MSCCPIDISKFEIGDTEKKFSDYFDAKKVLGMGAFSTVVGAVLKSTG